MFLYKDNYIINKLFFHKKKDIKKTFTILFFLTKFNFLYSRKIYDNKNPEKSDVFILKILI